MTIKKLAFFLIIIVVSGCNNVFILEETEPVFTEKYSLNGKINGVFTEFRKSQEGQGIGSPLEDNDSIEFTRDVTFMSLSDENLEVHIERRVFVPKSLLVEKDSLINDSVKTYIAQFKKFEDFKNLFQPGIYSYSQKDKIFTFITTHKGEGIFDWHFSYYQPTSEFTFSIDTLLFNSQNEKIYIAGKFNSINSSVGQEIKNIISLKNMMFSACFKNEWGFEPSK